MPRKFQYGPGLPGYGTRGVDGSAGLTGIATYFSSYDGASDTVTIKSKIIANKELFSTENLIPGYPTRTYQNGDIFIDRNARIYQVDFAEANLYKDTGIFLNTSGFFTSGPLQIASPTFQRYSNQFETEKYLIDSVYTNSVGDYTTFPTSIYDNAPLYYGSVKYIGQDIAPDLGSYYPFQVWTIGSSDDKDAIALARSKTENAWRFGNLENTMDVSLYLDFGDIYSQGTYHGAIDGTIVTTNIDIPGWLRVGGDSSILGKLNVSGIVTGGNITSGANPGHTHTGTSISALSASLITSGTLLVSRGGTGASSLSSNAILTGNGTSAIQAETTLTYSAGTITSLNSISSLLFDKQDRTFASGLAGNIAFQTSRATDGTGANADGGGWWSAKCDRGGSITSGSWDAGNGGIFQINGFDKTWPRGGSAVDGKAGLGGAVLIYSGNGGFASGTLGNPGGGGYLNIVAGDGGDYTHSTGVQDASHGGEIKIEGGSGGNSSSSSGSSFAGNGSNITIAAGQGGINSLSSARNGNGGDVIIRGGNATSSGNGGTITLDLGTGSPNGGLFIENIGTTGTTQPFHLAWDNANDQVIANSAIPSDSRLKNLDSSLNGRNILDAFNSFQAYNWTFNELSKTVWSMPPDMSTNHIGLVAQDVQPYFPEVISDLPAEDGSIYMVIDYATMAPLFVEAIKTLNDDISALKNENLTLTNDVSTLLYVVDNLLTRVEALEASIG